MCVCIYVCIHMNLYVHTHTYLHMYWHLYLCVWPFNSLIKYWSEVPYYQGEKKYYIANISRLHGKKIWKGQAHTCVLSGSGLLKVCETSAILEPNLAKSWKWWTLNPYQIPLIQDRWKLILFWYNEFSMVVVAWEKSPGVWYECDWPKNDKKTRQGPRWFSEMITMVTDDRCAGHFSCYCDKVLNKSNSCGRVYVHLRE